MQCPTCRAENPDKKIFCGDCGAKLVAICPNCQCENPPSKKYCGDCGHDLSIPTTKVPQPSKEETRPIILTTDHERKYVTVLFSDLSGYTAMTEKLDPEELKEIMGKIFGEVALVVVKYEGFIEKYVGDAILALFGVPKSHEDDPVRAIRTAREIHDIAKRLSPSLEKKIGRSLYMHTGINTGLVVTGDLNLEKGTHGVLGETINIASRLSELAETDEIIVGVETYHQTEGYFNFKGLEPVTVRGRKEPIKVYKVTSPREAPRKTHRLSGQRAKLIGRRVEMNLLEDAVENLRRGQGTIFSIIGDAGTGKSRLVEEFKSTLDLKEIQWREGHAYAFSQNIPYSPLIDLFNRTWQIKEGDPPDEVRRKVETGTKALIGERSDLIPYIGNLYAVSYPEIDEIPPELRQTRFYEAVQLILANLCKRAPAIICIEDLHLADPSSIEILRSILADFRYPAIFLCVYRPGFNLFTSHQAASMKSYNEIRLQDLSPTDAQDMVESLLMTKSIPKQLRKFIQDKAEGNPFYLEEVINSLIETDVLIHDDGSWILTRSLTEKDIPSTVQGVVSARLDRLEREAKRILQEASVIGRAFLYEILRRISDLKDYIDKSLMSLERLDLIKTRTLQPDLEYIFKNTLTQEVVYQGLLIKERRIIHEKIGLVMEELFHDRLFEFYETLAFHYSNSDNSKKACQYLKFSGDKAAQAYANWEAIRFYQQAILVLDTQTETQEIKREKMDLSLLTMGPMLVLGYPEGCLEILQKAEKLAKELGDEKCLARVYSYIGQYHTYKGNPSLGLDYTEKSFYEAEKGDDLDLMIQSASQVCAGYFSKGELAKLGDITTRTIPIIERHHREKDIILGRANAYSILCRWCGMALGWTGHFAEGKAMCEKALRVAHEINDRYSMGVTNFFYATISYWEGERDTTIDRARTGIRYHEEVGANVTLGAAWSILGAGYYLQGEYNTAKDHVEKGVKIQKDVGVPSMLPWCYLFMSMIYMAMGNMQGAEEYTNETLNLSQNYNNRPCECMAQILLGAIVGRISLAHLDEAEHTIRKGILLLDELKLRPLIAIGYLFLGELLSDAGKKADALQSLKKADTLYQDMEITSESYWLTRTRDLLRKLESEGANIH